jgi:hypothetical protein
MMLRHHHASALVALALTAALPAAQGRNLVTNGGFESGFTGWTVTHAPSGSFIAIFTNPGAGHTGNSFAQFLAFGTEPDRISQNLLTQPGQQYLVDFWLRSFLGDFQVGWGAATVLDHDASNGPTDWTEFQTTVTATGPLTRLELRGLGSIFLDDVAVNPVPAPGPCTMLAAACGVMGMRRRKRP